MKVLTPSLIIRISTGCCGSLYSYIGGNYYCSMCRQNLTRDIWAVDMCFQTGNKEWLYFGRELEKPIKIIGRGYERAADVAKDGKKMCPKCGIRKIFADFGIRWRGKKTKCKSCTYEIRRS